MLMEVQLSDRHEHPLVLSYDNKYIKRCHMCKKSINGTSFYYCAQCRFVLHYTCAVTLPQHINHPFHLQHPLTLIINGDYECNVCKKRYNNYNLNRPKSYTCFGCDFHIDIECALLPTIPLGKGIQPLCHLQAMSLIENYDEYDGGVLECYVCESPCPSGSSTSTFVCSICKRFIHYSCIEFPLMTHPFMPSSSPLLQVIRYGKPRCVSCHRSSHNFFILYINQRQHRIRLCLPCTFLRPTIEYPGHNHLLCFIEKYNSISDRCNAYDTCCRQPHVSSNDELNYTNKSFILSCAPCSFTLHLLCGPLPCTIKHKCHIHPLTLFDPIVEDNSGEYYCDACEMERDPRLCVYYCAECKFIAHVHCIISEVVRVLKGDLKDVKLRVVRQRKFDREVVSLSELELRAKRDIILDACRKKPTKSPKKEKQAHEVKNCIKELKYSEENYEKLIHRLLNQSTFRGRLNLLPCYEDLEKIEFVNVGDYVVSWKYGNILKDFLDKHGDVGAESKSTIDEKSLTYIILCRVLNSMCRTLLVDVTDDLLEDWHACLNVVKLKGFEIDFVYDHLEKFVRAYYCLQAIRAEKEKATQMDQNIADMQHQVVQLRRQIKTYLERIKEYEEYKKRPSFENNSDFMKCWSKASMLEWEAVGKDLV